MTDSQNAKPKCFSGILSRLLCRGSLPTHPSDHIPESNTTMFSDHLRKDTNSESKKEVPANTAPGIVARLMGLETLPDLEWVPKARISNSFARSRSVNSMDYLIEFNPPLAQHRRVRTSVSFREVVPTVLSQQNHEYFVFYLGNVDETGKFGAKLRKSEMGFEELNQKKAERIKNDKEKNREKVVVKKKDNAENKKLKSAKGKDEPRKVYGRNCSKVGDFHQVYQKPPATSKAKGSSKTVKQRAMPVVELKFAEKKKKKKKVQPTIKEAQSECPLSEVSTAAGLNLRRKFSPKTANFEYPSRKITRVSAGDGLKLGSMKNKDKKTLKITGQTEYYEKLVREICRLTQVDIKKPYWVGEEEFRYEDCEELCVDFGQQILDQLLHQAVHELRGCHM